MTDIYQDIKDGLNLALNEAIILGVDFDERCRTIYVTFNPVSAQKDGTIPIDNRFLFAFRNVGRLASSLTLEPESKAIKFDDSELGDKMSEF